MSAGYTPKPPDHFTFGLWTGEKEVRLQLAVVRRIGGRRVAA